MSTLPKTISFTIPAVPVAQPRQRHRIVSANGRQFVHNYTATNSPANVFKATARLAASQVYVGPPLESLLRAELTFVFPRPKAMQWKKRAMPRDWYKGRTDCDNLAKCLQDALIGLLFADDSQIVSATVEKWMAAGDEPPHVEAVFTEL